LSTLETGILPAFCSPRLSFRDNIFVLHLFFFAYSKILFHISRGHIQMAVHVASMSYFLTCFSFPSLRIPLTWINSQCRLVRVEKKGFSCLEENVLRTVTIEMIGKFLPPYPPFPISSFLSSCFRHSSRIALPRYCAHKRITTYTSTHKILCTFASIAKMLWRFDSNML